MTEINILVVEDEALVAEDIQIRLEKMGYRVVAVCGSGEEAVANTEKIKPDVVLMDIRLSGEMDGVEAADQIQSRWSIPVIFLTAYSNDEILKRAKVTEPFGYIIKPVQDRDVRVSLEMAVYKAQTEREREQLINDLQEALTEVKTLRGLIPICAKCKKIRDDEGYWQQIEKYISDHSEVQFSHGICPVCAKELYPEFYEDK